MSKRQAFPAALFDQVGLNRQHLFNLDSLPGDIRAKLGDTGNFRQLILLGHGGKRLWECVQAADLPGDDPIDDYVMQSIRQIFARHLGHKNYRVVYPGDTPMGLQQLGKLAGWHQSSPFMVGIDAVWGSWFAYRAVILADTDFLPILPVDRSASRHASDQAHPCSNCSEPPCMTACPVGAVTNEAFALAECLAYRQSPASACQFTCLARVACPVGSEHRYNADQLRHCYGISLRLIRQFTSG
ncbi:MAG: hypothetical protein CVU16_13260 [Betaproteobacteria bacterium HGW-Betaproteobacteria-10]|nr:MAG: hypothetical protein CVU16_13260 [Betaproteobacteria bacterium HGW-Betaproteobacteria-10]